MKAVSKIRGLRGLAVVAGVVFAVVFHNSLGATTESQHSIPSGQLQAVVVGKDGAHMIFIPAGYFSMGEDHPFRIISDILAPLLHSSIPKDHSPKHEVYLDAFYIDIFELTTDRYAQFLTATQRPQPEHWSEVNLAVHGNRPVIGVTWFDANEYCHWAGRRLPTEAEWERAARGITGREYPWGDSLAGREQDEYAMRNKGEWTGYSNLWAVGKYEPGKTPEGIYDMGGNAMEWVADWYDEGFYLKSPENANNPSGPSNGEFKVVRDISGWSKRPWSTYERWREPPDKRSIYTGFRCAQSAVH